MPRYLSKLARALTLTAMLAAMNLAGVTAVAQAHATDQATVAETGRPVNSPQQAAADTAHRRQLAQERSSVPRRGPDRPGRPDTAHRARRAARLAHPRPGRAGRGPGPGRRGRRPRRPAGQPHPRRPDGLSTPSTLAAAACRNVAL